MPETIVITGASAGFGAASARLFAAKGWKLVLIARRRDRLEQLASQLGAARVHALELDVRDRTKVFSLLSRLPAEFRDVDVLLNNAGLALGLDPAHEASIDDWEAMVDTNCKGLLYCTRCVLPRMVERNHGHIVNIGSTAGSWPYPGGNAYGATKAFVKQFSMNLRADLVGTNVRVSNIEPGLADTEFSIVRFKGDTARATQVYQGTRPLTGDDIAQVVYWVVSCPPHVNINSVEVMPVCQAWGPMKVHRQDE
ncbi:MAG: SDR family oxidoreductase [Planctomycetota bacterium]